MENGVNELQIVKTYEFISELQRMSVIVKNPKNVNFKVFCKGNNSL